MTASFPSKCCVSGVKHEGESTGEFVTINNVKAYVAGDKSSPNVILHLTDIFGSEFINNRLLADSYAAQGYYVVLPDLFNGDAYEYGKPVDRSWFANHQVSDVEPIVFSTLKYIKEELKPKFIGAVGHCFGAKYVIRLLDGKIDAGVAAHPSLVELSEVEQIKKPLLIAAAETDPIFTDELRAQTEAKLKEIKATYFVSLISGVAHGFAVRGDPKDKWATIAKEKAFADSIWWYKLFQS